MTEPVDPVAPSEDDDAVVVPPPSAAASLPAVVGSTVEALPGLARIAASAWWHTTTWGVRTSADVGRRAVGAFLDAAGSVADVTEPPVVEARTSETASLRERGARLLERSRDVYDEGDAHPAYERILDELAPDEARILLLLLEGGPQPSVDVRTGGPVGMVNSQLIAPGLSMIGARAGCRHVDQVPAYLNNLFRLGLVWFSRESVTDPMEYQVLEAQPDVLAAMGSVKFAKVVRRSIHLTPFGEDFVREVLGPADAQTDYPPHQAPEQEGDLDPDSPPSGRD